MSNVGPHGLVYHSLRDLCRRLLGLVLSRFFLVLQLGVLLLGDAAPVKQAVYVRSPCHSSSVAPGPTRRSSGASGDDAAGVPLNSTLATTSRAI